MWYASSVCLHLSDWSMYAGWHSVLWFPATSHLCQRPFSSMQQPSWNQGCIFVWKGFPPPFLLFTPWWSKSSLLLRVCTIIILLFQPFPFCMFWWGSLFHHLTLDFPRHKTQRIVFMITSPPAWWPDITSLSYTLSLFHLSSYFPFSPFWGWVTSDITAFSSRSPLY